MGGKHLRKGKPHLARRVVSNEPHRINAFVCGTGSHQHLLSAQVWHRCGGEERLHDFLWFGHAAGTRGAAGQLAAGRVDNADANGTQIVDIALHGRTFPHLGIHRRSQIDGFAHERKQQCAQRVVAYAGGHLANDIGSGRSHHHHFSPVLQRYVLSRVVVVGVEKVGIDFIARHGFQCQGRDKLERVLGGHALHLVPRLAQQAHQERSLISGNAARYANKDPHTYCWSAITLFSSSSIFCWFWSSLAGLR